MTEGRRFLMSLDIDVDIIEVVAVWLLNLI